MSVHDGATRPKPVREGFDGPRACRRYELAPLLDTLALVFNLLATPPGQPQQPPTVGYSWSHIYNYENLDNIRLITRDGLVVSSVGFFPAPRGPLAVRSPSEASTCRGPSGVPAEGPGRGGAPGRPRKDEG